MNAYVPQPGTIPARVIAYFDSLPPGTEVAGAVLADLLDVETNVIGPCLAHPVKHGAMMRECRDGRVYWRRGDDVLPLQTEHDDDDVFVHRIGPARGKASPGELADRAARTRRREGSGSRLPKSMPAAIMFEPVVAEVVPSEAPTSPPCVATAHPAPVGCDSGAPGASSEAEPCCLERGGELGRKPAAGASLRVALWSDGQLAIERGGERIDFTVEEVRAIVAYLDRMAAAE
jgi:hypothetical protein